ncbi:sulfotransferase family protein [Mariniblastus sp.]|nr:sulfotransferase family protein [Mariniblastus sp.]
MILSHDKKFIFVHLYKTGGTSIRRCLEKYDAAYKIHHWAKSKLTAKPVFNSPIAHKHATASTIRETVGADIFDQYFSFCFVRNPWAWQVSLYHYVLKKMRHEQHELFKSFQCFDDYLAWRCDGNVQLQKEYLVDGQDNQIVKFIGRMENFNQDFQEVCKTLQIDSPALPHLNQSVSTSYREFYDSKSETMLAEAFREDIELLDYEF